MYLDRALGITSADQIDITRSLTLGPFELGSDAATEAVRIYNEGEALYDVTWQPREFSEPIYWFVQHHTDGQVELFGFPTGSNIQLPTAIEIALVRAIAATMPEHHAEILGGGCEIAIGPIAACEKFRQIIGAKHPLVGQSLLFAGSNQVLIHENSNKFLSSVVQKCFINSFQASPLKFRYLEIYRVIEARFLADVRAKLFSKFDEEPGTALAEAQEALKSEMNQIIGLAETQKDAFEACWTALDQIRNTNRFAAALFRKLEKRKLNKGVQWQSGAALIYQIRCAIVHSGEKDLIFEEFLDGNDAIDKVISYIERAALLLAGVDIS